MCLWGLELGKFMIEIVNTDGSAQSKSDVKKTIIFFDANCFAAIVVVLGLLLLSLSWLLKTEFSKILSLADI